MGLYSNHQEGSEARQKMEMQMTYIITKHNRQGFLVGYVTNASGEKAKFTSYRTAMIAAKALNASDDLCYSVDLAIA